LELALGGTPDAPLLDATLGLTARLTSVDPDTGATVERELTYDASASGPQN